MSDTDRGLSRAQIVKQLDASLERLRTDYVDLYQCHRYDDQTPLEETMEALTRAVDSGKVRYIGFSEWPADRIQAALGITGVAKFVSSQPQYSLLWREPEEEVIPLCAANGVSQIVWSPLAQGVLSGKYDPDQPPPAGSRATSDEMGGFISWLMKPEILRAVQRLKPIAEAAGTDVAAIRAGVDSSRAERGIGNHRRFPAQPGAGKCRGVRRRDRYSAIHRGRADHCGGAVRACRRVTQRSTSRSNLARSKCCGSSWASGMPRSIFAWKPGTIHCPKRALAST